MDATQPVLPEARRQFIDALRDPALSQADIEQLSAKLQPYGRFNPECFRLLEQAVEHPGRPLAGGLADVPKIAGPLSVEQPAFRAKKGYLDTFWVGTPTALVIALPVSWLMYAWPWGMIAGVERGRNVGKLGSVRVAFVGGDVLKVRIAASDVDLVMALWERYGNPAESSN